jgi:hypothetical protein
MLTQAYVACPGAGGAGGGAGGLPPSILTSTLYIVEACPGHETTIGIDFSDPAYAMVLPLPGPPGYPAMSPTLTDALMSLAIATICTKTASLFFGTAAVYFNVFGENGDGVTVMLPSLTVTLRLLSKVAASNASSRGLRRRACTNEVGCIRDR